MGQSTITSTIDAEGSQELVEESSEQETSPNGSRVEPLGRSLTHVSLFHCAICREDLLNIFHGVPSEMQRLHLENPQEFNDEDLISLLAKIDGRLKFLIVEGYVSSQPSTSEDEEEGASGVTKRSSTLVNQILVNCPNLVVFDFPEGIADGDVFQYLIGSKLESWSFTTTKEVRWVHGASSMMRIYNSVFI